MKIKDILKNVVLEQVSDNVKKTMLKKFSTQTDDKPETILQYIRDFGDNQNSIDRNARDITKYDYTTLKKTIKHLQLSKQNKETLNKIVSKYMATDTLGRGGSLGTIKYDIKKFMELQPTLPESLKDIFKIPHLRLNKLVNKAFGEMIRTKGYEHLKNENPNATPEQILIRLNQYIERYNELPWNSIPLLKMDFNQFEHLVDALPAKEDGEVIGDVDLGDTKIVHEDDNVLIFLGNKKQQCIDIRKKYAPNRRWCTSWEGSGNYYYNYRLAQNLTLYYVINKTKDPSDLDYASVILVETDGSKRLADGSNSGRYSGGGTIPWKEIVGKIPVIDEFDELLEPIPLTADEVNKFKIAKNAQVEVDAVKELGEEGAEVWIELMSPNLAKNEQTSKIFENLPDNLKKKYIGLGLDMNPEMIQVASPDVQKYYLNKKLDTIKNKALRDLNDSEMGLISTNIFPKTIKDQLKERYFNEITDTNGTILRIGFPNDISSKFVKLFGLEEIFNSAPDNIRVISISNTDTNPPTIQIPPSISRFKELQTLNLENSIDELPKEVGELKNLEYLSLLNNPNLKSLPKELSKLNKLVVVNIKGCDPNIQIPNEVILTLKKSEENGGYVGLPGNMQL